MGLYVEQLLDLSLPQTGKQLLAIAETDGCFVSGISVTTGCSISRRTLRIEDYGKIATTFFTVDTEQALRIAPRLDVRQRANQYAPHRKQRYYAQLEGYQIMPNEEMFFVQEVSLSLPVERIIGKAGVRVNCGNCGEEIINQREIFQDGRLLCKACSGQAYYNHYETTISVETWSCFSSIEDVV